jgi:predicted nucleic acid-binding protein
VKYLLDVNALLAAILSNHPKHQIVDAWIQKKDLATCPLSELGFIRISTNPKAYNLSMSLARQALEGFLGHHKADFIAADLPALKSNSSQSAGVTDYYLAELAGSKGLRLATLDTGIAHSSVELIL